MGPVTISATENYHATNLIKEVRTVHAHVGKGATTISPTVMPTKPPTKTQVFPTKLPTREPTTSAPTRLPTAKYTLAPTNARLGGPDAGKPAPLTLVDLASVTKEALDGLKEDIVDALLEDARTAFQRYQQEIKPYMEKVADEVLPLVDESLSSINKNLDIYIDFLISKQDEVAEFFENAFSEEECNANGQGLIQTFDSSGSYAAEAGPSFSFSFRSQRCFDIWCVEVHYPSH